MQYSHRDPLRSRARHVLVIGVNRSSSNNKKVPPPNPGCAHDLPWLVLLSSWLQWHRLYVLRLGRQRTTGSPIQHQHLIQPESEGEKSLKLNTVKSFSGKTKKNCCIFFLWRRFTITVLLMMKLVNACSYPSITGNIFFFDLSAL